MACLKTSQEHPDILTTNEAAFLQMTELHGTATLGLGLVSKGKNSAPAPRRSLIQALAVGHILEALPLIRRTQHFRKSPGQEGALVDMAGDAPNRVVWRSTADPTQLV